MLPDERSNKESVARIFSRLVSETLYKFIHRSLWHAPQDSNGASAVVIAYLITYTEVRAHKLDDFLNNLQATFCLT